MKTINHEKIINEKLDDLLTLDCYIPLCLHCYLDNTYFDRATDEAKQRYYKARTDLQCTSDKGKYMREDLSKWLEEHKEFADILKDG